MASKTGRRMAITLLGGTMLGGMPAILAAQDTQTAEPASPVETPQAQGQTIRSIAIVGSQRLEPNTIISYISLRTGQEYSQAAADQAIKELYATELFANATLRNDDGNVVIEVVENPVVNRIILEGNKRLKNDKILPEIKLSPRQIFTRSKVRADTARIVELYKRQGRFAAVIEPKIVELSQNRVDVVYEISEGPKSKVRQINIIGNEVFSDGELRSEMVTKADRGLLTFLSSNTSYDPDRLAFDQQKLRQFYLTEGYADFRVVSAVAELTPDKRDFIITYVVEEGERYKFGDVAVESQIRDFDGDSIGARLPMKEGDFYDAKLIEDTVEQLTELAGTFGYAFADVRPRFDRNKDELEMNITFILNEAPRVYVERIDVNGNTLTQDKVLRREFRIAEGDAFNSLAIKRSTNRIKSLGFFQENFEIEQKEGSRPDRIILEANVEEQPTGELQLSAGFSSLESFILSGSIRQRNFRGRGQTVGASVNYSRFSKAFNLSFSEPYVFDRNISAGVDIYLQDFSSVGFNRNRNSDFEQSTLGGRVRAGVPLSEYLSLVGSYTLNFDSISVGRTLFGPPDEDGNRQCLETIALCDVVGDRVSSILGATLAFDNLNSRFRPTSGSSVSFTTEFAGLGGDVKYLRLRGRAAKYWDVLDGFIFSVSAEGGAIKGLEDRPGIGVDDVRLNDRFQLGEPQFRGFDIRGVGPRVVGLPYVDDDNDPATPVVPLSLEEARETNRLSDISLGGNAYYLGRAELEIPLGSGARELGLRPSVFVDVGSLFSVTQPPLRDQPDGLRLLDPTTGAPLFIQTDLDDMGAPVTTQVTVPVNPNTGEANTPSFDTRFAVKEFFLGDTAKPRVTAGVGVNWNSPFGPFRIDVAQTILSEPGDDTKRFTFNVGTQF